MHRLIPRDRWQCGASDFFRGLVAAVRPRENDETLDLPGLPGCIPVGSGRAGLVTALNALGLPPGASIGVPLFCCPLVFDAVISAGCRPEFVDVDAATFCISASDLAAKHSRLAAAIAVHMFGNPCDIPALTEALRGKPLIEDCAQALGSLLDGQPVGSWGDAAVFSFRAGKFVSAGEGGAVCFRNTQTHEKMARRVQGLPAAGRMNEVLHLVTTHGKAVLRNRPLYGLLGRRLWEYRSRRASAPPGSTIGERRIFRSDMAIARRRLKGLNASIAAHRANAELLAHSLTLPHRMLCSERPGTFYNRYLYPITLDSQIQRDTVANNLFRRQVDTMKYLDHVVDTATAKYGYSGGCPETESLSNRVLVIPNYCGLTEREIRHIAESANSALKSCAVGACNI